jgi:type VI secretion system protein VasJ
LLNRQGYGGLAQGLATLQHLSGTYWDTLFPETKRMRARISALDWLNERGAQAVENRKTSGAGDKDPLAGCIAAIESLDGLLREKLGGEAPSLSDVKRALKSKHDEIKVAAPPQPQAAAAAAGAVAGATPVAAPAVAAAPAFAPGEDIDKTLNKIWGMFRDAAPGLRESRPQDPTAYRLARLGAWMPMQQVPPNTDGITRMQPMGASGAIVEQYDGMVAQSDWNSLLQQAESQFEKSVLWLDAQRYVAMALEGLGYADAVRAVKAECSLLINRFPTLTNLKFSNETPFASDDAKSWLRQELGGGGGGDDGGAAAVYVPAGEEDDEIDRVVLEAKELVKKKKAVQATAILRDAVDNAVSRRQRFRRRLALARFLTEMKQHRLAVAQLECLDEDIDRYHLEEWDPGVASQVLSLYVACHKQLLKGEWKTLPDAAQIAEKIFSRLARIDTTAALGLSK